MAHPRPRVSLFLTVAAVAMTGVVFLEREHGLFSMPIQNLPEVTPIIQKSNSMPAAPTLPPLSAFAEVSSRPLFSETRRPPDSAVVEETSTQEAASKQDLFVVLGVATSDQQRAALIQLARNRDILSVGEGDEVDGWKVVSIRVNGVVFEKGGSQKTIEIQNLEDAESRTRRLERRLPVKPTRRFEIPNEAKNRKP